MQPEGNGQQHDPRTLEHWRGPRRAGGKKRNYVHDFSSAYRCPHNVLRAIATGTNAYTCEDCKYVFWINSSVMWPVHFMPIFAAQTIQHFVKEYGVNALMETVRTPIGQYDKTAHKAVIPDGAQFIDTLMALEGVDATAPDHGKGELRALYEKFWVQAALQAGAKPPSELEQPHDESAVPRLPERPNKRRPRRSKGG